MNQALMRELISGRILKQQLEESREKAAGAEAFSSRGHKSIKGLGKLAAVVPQHEYFTIRSKYGEDCWHDREFIRDYQRLMPTMKVHEV